MLEKAEKENDYQFLSGVQKAFKFTEEKLAFKVTAKDLVRIAIYSLLAFGYKGTKSQLRELLDPDSNKFKGDGFDEIVKDAKREIKGKI